jgi:hypothetical protein
MPPLKGVFNPIGVEVYALLLRVFTWSLAEFIPLRRGLKRVPFRVLAYPESRFARLYPVFKGAYLKLGYIR